jgi:DNA-binding beta-propeller fold protein YncE
MPEGIAYNTANNKMYVTNWCSNTVSANESLQGTSSHSRFDVDNMNQKEAQRKNSHLGQVIQLSLRVHKLSGQN